MTNKHQIAWSRGFFKFSKLTYNMSQNGTRERYNNMKSYVANRMALITITLSDLERRVGWSKPF